MLRACVARLRDLEPVRDVDIRPNAEDGQLILTTGQGRLTYACRVKHGLNRARLEHALLGLRPAREPRSRLRPILLTDFLPGPLADVLDRAQIDYVDAAGNMSLRWPGKLYVRVRGAAPIRAAEATAGQLTTPTGLVVIFTLLAEGNREARPYRTVAEKSGVSLAAVGRVAAELRRRGFLVLQGRKRRLLRRRRELLDLWIGGYSERLRPRLVVGRFQAAERDLAPALARFVDQARETGIGWALTGGFAADLLTGHYRGDQLVLFVESWRPDVTAALRWLPAREGPITVLRALSPGVTREPLMRDALPVAHPLLVYAELLFEGHEREIETARLVYEQYLAGLARDA